MSDDDDELSDDGTSDIATQLVEALTTFDSHTSATDSKTIVTAEERARIAALCDDSKGGDTDHLVHQLRVTVKPSVDYQTGNLPSGRMAKAKRIDPTTVDFGKDLEKLLMQTAVHESTADYSFNQAGRIRIIDGVPTAGTFFLLFTAKRYCTYFGCQT